MAKKKYVRKISRYESKNYSNVKKRVRKRDNFTCQMCGRKLHPTQTKIHHIQTYADNPRLRECEKNLICLDRECHDKIKGKEQYYIQYFMRKVREKYEDNSGH